MGTTPSTYAARPQGRTRSQAGDARDLDAKQAEIRQDIAALEQFICSAPARAAALDLERLETIPPPEGECGAAAGRRSTRMLRAHSAAIRSRRRRHMMLFLIAAVAFAAFTRWLALELTL